MFSADQLLLSDSFAAGALVENLKTKAQHCVLIMAVA
jgi:hypothetical protein